MTNENENLTAPIHKAHAFFTEMMALGDALEAALRPGAADITAQAHALNDIFHHLIIAGVNRDSLDHDIIRLALLAQRQCVHTAERVSRHKAAIEKTKFPATEMKDRKNENDYKGLATRPPQGPGPAHPPDQTVGPCHRPAHGGR